jgi:HSP20 family protein
MASTRLAPRNRTLLPFLSRPFATTTLSPFANVMEEFRELSDEMMRGAFEAPEFQFNHWFPAVNMAESKKEFMLTAEVPGMTTKDVNIDYCDGMLTIRGEKEQEQKETADDATYYRWERSFGKFQRSFPFPGGIDESKITAEIKDGILTVHVPKAEEAQAKHRPIPVLTK